MNFMIGIHLDLCSFIVKEKRLIRELINLIRDGQLRRFNYVTPTSYLELMSTFRKVTIRLKLIWIPILSQ